MRRTPHMKAHILRFTLAAVVAAILGLAAAVAGAPSGGIKQPDKLIILSTTDVKGRTNPCG